MKYRMQNRNKEKIRDIIYKKSLHRLNQNKSLIDTIDKKR